MRRPVIFLQCARAPPADRPGEILREAPLRRSPSASRRALRASRALLEQRACRTLVTSGSIAQRRRLRQSSAAIASTSASRPAPVLTEIATTIDAVERLELVHAAADRSCSRRPRARRDRSCTPSSSRSSTCKRPRSIEHHEHQIGDAASDPSRAPHAFLFDDIVRVANAGRIDQRERQPPMSARSVSRSRVVPGIAVHDRAIGVQQRIEQARLADVRRADDATTARLREPGGRARRAPAARRCR